MRVLFKTHHLGHLVSEKEYKRLKKGFAKKGIELFREEREADIILVKSFAHTWQDIAHYKKPIVMYSTGGEWKKGIDIEKTNEPARELYLKSNAVVHISDYCRKNMERFWGKRDKTYVIIPAEEPHLPEVYPDIAGTIKCISIAIWRAIKRPEEMERVFALLKKELPVELDLFGAPLGPMVSDLSFYHDYHIFVQLSRKEGMPNTVLEALSYGLPCLVTNCGGAKEAVGDAGVVIYNDPPDEEMFDLSNIEPIDYDKFRTGFMKLYNNLGYYRQKVRDRVLNELNDEICAEQFKKVFENL